MARAGRQSRSEASMRSQRAKRVTQGGLGPFPRKILNFRPSQIVSGAILG